MSIKYQHLFYEAKIQIWYNFHDKLSCRKLSGLVLFLKGPDLQLWIWPVFCPYLKKSLLCVCCVRSLYGGGGAAHCGDGGVSRTEQGSLCSTFQKIRSSGIAGGRAQEKVVWWNLFIFTKGQSRLSKNLVPPFLHYNIKAFKMVTK